MYPLLVPTYKYPEASMEGDAIIVPVTAYDHTFTPAEEYECRVVPHPKNKCPEESIAGAESIVTVVDPTDV